LSPETTEQAPTDALSGRAQSYINSLTRRAAVRDEGEILRRFRDAQVPDFEPVVRFQQQFGGLEELYGRNLFVWGLFHDRPDPDSAFEPNRPHTFKNGDRWFFTCADCHRSDHWFLDQTGALYWCFEPPRASSFARKVERDAVVWELTRTRSPRRLVFEVPDAAAVQLLVPRLEPGLIPEASDEYEALYLHGGLYIAVKGSRMIAYACEGFDASLLRDLPCRIEDDAPRATPAIKPWWKFW
jgi:hypothetical protein